MAKVRDPNGEELFPTLMQVTERDDCNRPTVCRIRYDDENIALSGEVPNKFVMVWAPAGSEMDVDALMAQFNGLKRQALEARELVVSTRRDLDRIVTDNARMSAELEQKTAALRELQKERDPAAIERKVTDAIWVATGRLEDALTAAASRIAMQDSEIRELKASKKKLREALERAKEKK